MTDPKSSSTPGLGGPAVGSRTPIRFGQTVQHVADRRLRGFETIYQDSTERFIILILRTFKENDWYGFILVQGARQAGRFTAEVAVSRRYNYPYYEATFLPLIGVDGVRVRSGYLLSGDDRWWVYRSQNELEVMLMEALGQSAEKALRELGDQFMERLDLEMDGFHGMYRLWEEDDVHRQDVPLGGRFPDLTRERAALQYIQGAIHTTPYARILGPLRANYTNSRWLSCHTFFMSHVMENADADVIAQFDGRWIPFVEDQIQWPTGRMSIVDCLTVGNTREERLLQYSFLKSLAVCEAIYKGVEDA